MKISIGMGILLLAMAISLGVATMLWHTPTTPIVHPPTPPVHDVQSEVATKEYLAALDVARVFGRSEGCANADAKLITDVAAEAVNDGLDPRILAATVAVESACDPMAVSNRGAIGLTQVVPKVWKAKFDFTKVNLLNPTENLHAGAIILSDLIKQYGVQNGVRRYNGLGVGCDGCDAGYVSKIVLLAGRR